MTDKWTVLKFGGTSVTGLSNWKTIAQVLQTKLKTGNSCVLVCSALSGVSNLLDQTIEQASTGNNFERELQELRKAHIDLCAELQVPEGMDALKENWDLLNRLFTGIYLIRQCSPKIKAQIMAQGELMLSRIGSLWLLKQGLPAVFLDIRPYLNSIPRLAWSEQQHFLSAVCHYDRDQQFSKHLKQHEERIFLTQGFIASDDKGDTVLLGRGGSDTTASYIGAKIGAEKVEIWTDVPGMFTSNPREIPSAKLLLNLDYEEAQELATSGAKVLHPRCLDPVKEHNIPLHICWTERPEFQGMVIGPNSLNKGPRVKAVIAKKSIHMISMSTLGMWHQVGFMSDIFQCFKTHGFSVDLVATSQSNVTVTLDSIANIMDEDSLQNLLDDLSEYCKPKSLGPVAAVSIVGRNIRAMIHELGPFLEAFEEKQIYLISQSASDLNFTFTIDEEEVGKIVPKLHALFFSDAEDPEIFGPSWNQLFFKDSIADPIVMTPWWKNEREKLLQLVTTKSPLFVYHKETLIKYMENLKSISSVSRINYAMKANSHNDILQLFYQEGLGFDCVSIHEIYHLYQMFPDIKKTRILFTPNFAAISEYMQALEFGCIITLDNTFPLKHYPEVFSGKEIFIRIDPDIGRGHHKHVRTAGPQSKFGIGINEIDEILELTKTHGIVIRGLHVHVGSGILTPETWSENALFMLDLAQSIPTVEVVNLGGGFGVVEKPGQKPLDIEMVAESLKKVKKAYLNYEIWIEPGRYLVANAGVLLAHVTQLKSKGHKNFVGLNVGMNSLLRPALYGSYHEIRNLTRLDEKDSIKADVVGPICESGDVFGHARVLPESKEHDVFLLATAGAYGREMASFYNKRPPAEEYFFSSSENL